MNMPYRDSRPARGIPTVHCREDVKTLLVNGRVHSPAMPDATAMAVSDGIVAWLGTDDVGRAQFPDADVIDLD
ncbi:MAG: hypothetical protein QOK12_2755, partial [Mycobacterium sp.]|nr:hypothetical protein [Mycobacterium sp.]